MGLEPWSLQPESGTLTTYALRVAASIYVLTITAASIYLLTITTTFTYMLTITTAFNYLQTINATSNFLLSTTTISIDLPIITVISFNVLTVYESYIAAFPLVKCTITAFPAVPSPITAYTFKHRPSVHLSIMNTTLSCSQFWILPQVFFYHAFSAMYHSLVRYMSWLLHQCIIHQSMVWQESPTSRCSFLSFLTALRLVHK